MRSIRVLGIDPGLTRCGVGVVEGQVGRQLQLVDVGVIRTPAELDLAKRLLRLEVAIEAIVERVAPDVLAVERVFSQHNVRTVMGTAQASAVAMLVAARHGIDADKEQVAQMVARVLRLQAAPKPADAADALALAICHIWRGSAQNRLTDAITAAGAR